MPRDILVLGSTGSIGRQTLDVVASLPEQFHISGLAALGRGEIPLMLEQCRRFEPASIAIADPAAAAEITPLLKPLAIKVFAGAPAATDLATRGDYDICVAAIAGDAGLLPTFAAAATGARIALANKEVLVMGGALFLETLKSAGGELLPVDSEHSAIHQALRAGYAAEVENLILTASGGALRDFSPEEIATATVEDVLRHPTWLMGPKITVDSATMMNKGLEVIEAHWLFHLPAEHIKVLIHPQSVVHSLVEYRDGSVIGQLGAPDMRLPIQYALTYPERLPGLFGRLNLSTVGTLNFDEPAPGRYPCLELAYQALAAGGLATALLSGANETAVGHFLAGRCRIPDIAGAVEHALSAPVSGDAMLLNDIIAAEGEGSRRANAFLGLGGGNR